MSNARRWKGSEDSTSAPHKPRSAVVLGIGNTLMQDEGVGVHAVKALVRRYELDLSVRVVDGGTSCMELLPTLEGVDLLIVVDAVRMGQPPASVHRLEGDQVPTFFKTKLSPHQVGLSDLLATLAFLGSTPERIVLIGVQPVSLSLGMELSPEVKAQLEEMVRLVVSELDESGFPSKLRV